MFNTESDSELILSTRILHDFERCRTNLTFVVRAPNNFILELSDRAHLTDRRLNYYIGVLSTQFKEQAGKKRPAHELMTESHTSERS